MSWFLAALGFVVLVVLHEGGHFAAAKAVGMRVERFSLFFGRPLMSFRRGETEYAIGPIPAGGYVRITGMNPREEFSDDVAVRAYYRQPVWKRIVVIAAGPAVNVLVAFLILWALVLANGTYVASHRIAPGTLEQPAARYLRAGDRIVSVDGVSGDLARISAAVRRHTCAERPPVAGCVATTAAHVVVVRDGGTAGRARGRLAFDIQPRYDPRVRFMRLGFTYGERHQTFGVVAAAGQSVTDMWNVTTRTLTVFTHLFQARDRKQVRSIVGAYQTTQQAVASNGTLALEIFALISLSLAIINLFPFLPLDGGHIFWALAEKVRGRQIPFSVMESASAVGFALVLMLFLVGFSNDLGRL